jgi:hypothetical protein
MYATSWLVQDPRAQLIRSNEPYLGIPVREGYRLGRWVFGRAKHRRYPSLPKFAPRPYRVTDRLTTVPRVYASALCLYCICPCRTGDEVVDVAAFTVDVVHDNESLIAEWIKSRGYEFLSIAARQPPDSFVPIAPDVSREVKSESGAREDSDLALLIFTPVFPLHDDEQHDNRGVD